MNKGEIRTRVLEQVDWNPSQSSEFKARVDRLINRAYQILSLEAPFLFFENEARIITQPDVASNTGEATDVLAVDSSDTYVLKRSYPVGTTITNTWVTDGTWDGRMIEITQSDGTVLRRRCREFWSVPGSLTSGIDTIDYVTIDIPWPNSTDTGMTYRIFTPHYYLPADVSEIRSARLWSDTHYQMDVATQHDMERYEYLDYKGSTNGRPHVIFRGSHRQIDAPNTAPIAAIKTDHGGEDWLGPEPTGVFDYCFTYVWGKRESELQSPQGHYEPLWESAPSPISAKVEMNQISQKISSTQIITVTLPNIDHALNFYKELVGSSLLTPTRSTHSGIKKRIYVRRYEAYADQPVGSPIIETPEIFFLLEEVDGSEETYTHNGSVIPDYYRRLKEVHGYQSIRMWPNPDASYEVDLRVLRRPQPLVHDHDAPRIHEEGVDLIIQRALSFLYELQGNHEVSALASQRYGDILQTLTKRFGNLTRLRPTKRAARIGKQSREVRVRYTE